MNSSINIQTHFRKTISQEISNTLSNYDSNYNIINNIRNRPFLNSNRTRTPLGEDYKYNLIKKQSSPLELIRYNRSKYTSNTHNPLLIMNNRRNKEENSKNENNSSVNIQKMKKSLDNKYNLSNDNHLKIKIQEKPYISIHNQRGKGRNIQSSSDLNSKNYNSNKFLINEELDNNNAKNIQTKTTRVLRIKNTENNNKNKADGSNRRLNLKSVEPQKRHQNTIFYSSNITHINDTKKDVRQNSLNNHKFYDSNYSRRNKKETNSTIPKTQVTNNINTINIQTTL